MEIKIEFDIDTREVILPSGRRVDYFSFEQIPFLPYETVKDKLERIVQVDFLRHSCPSQPK